MKKPLRLYIQTKGRNPTYNTTDVKTFNEQTNGTKKALLFSGYKLYELKEIKDDSTH